VLDSVADAIHCDNADLRLVDVHRRCNEICVYKRGPTSQQKALRQLLPRGSSELLLLLLLAWRWWCACGIKSYAMQTVAAPVGVCYELVLYSPRVDRSTVYEEMLGINRWNTYSETILHETKWRSFMSMFTDVDLRWESAWQFRRMDVIEKWQWFDSIVISGSLTAPNVSLGCFIFLTSQQLTRYGLDCPFAAFTASAIVARLLSHVVSISWLF
jgi:hypothetical protein